MLQTYIGDILLAVNPYQHLNLYGAEVRMICNGIRLSLINFGICGLIFGFVTLQPTYRC